VTVPPPGNKIAIVIGGSGGLGAAVCRNLAAEWGVVGIGYRSNVERADAVAKDMPTGCEMVTLPIELRDTGSIESALAVAEKRYGGLGALIYASGATIAQPYVAQIGEADWRDVIETELIGFTHLVRIALPIFRRGGGGVFVNVTSFANVFFPPGDALSSVPKAGIESLSRAIAKEEGKFGIRSNCVAPGIINAGLGAALQEALFTEQIWEDQRKRVPLRRFGEAQEIAEAVAFLASERSRYITGQTLVVDGGLSL
jgi:NAD(P)-dependent dehydrogenase (short-subunit alcohol dehydrogenase family)